jgi:hypothetical protein
MGERATTHDPMMSMSHWGQFPVGYHIAVGDGSTVHAVYVPVNEEGQPLFEPIYQRPCFEKPV